MILLLSFHAWIVLDVTYKYSVSLRLVHPSEIQSEKIKSGDTIVNMFKQAIILLALVLAIAWAAPQRMGIPGMGNMMGGGGMMPGMGRGNMGMGNGNMMPPGGMMRGMGGRGNMLG
ncbi:unnamed protein product [Callosobruchus maculatus]|uniref:Uncharacterized protein n=1 Tax=Callosobruchus maculatus TaxID=64391 RepID=A0A653BW15_CALMS|nr:unnamed protein product [Callosobruchus maculatus]